jgi:hypothetical protein
LLFYEAYLLTNATVVDDAIRFVCERSKVKEKLNPSANDSQHDNKEESNEPGYDEDNDQLEIEQEQKTREINGTTINQVF